jgi:hypothetical protein
MEFPHLLRLASLPNLTSKRKQQEENEKFISIKTVLLHYMHKLQEENMKYFVMI